MPSDSPAATRGRRLLVLALCSAPALAVVVFGLFLLVVVAAAAGNEREAGRQATLAPGAGVPARYRPLIQKAVRESSCGDVLTAPLLAAQLQQESAGWDPRATSPVGAHGLAQFMPGTWRAHGVDGDGDGVASVWNPADAIPSMAGYDCTILEQVKALPGDRVALMLAGYNAGPGAVAAAGGVPDISETQAYVRQIKSSAATMSASDLSPFTRLPEGELGAVIQAARSQLGVPYVFGAGSYRGPGHGMEPGRGFDCSGLTSYAFYQGSEGAVKLPRTADAQARAGVPVPADLSKMRPGDLVAFNLSSRRGGGIDHVGIYLGSGQMINAGRNSPSALGAVRINDLTTSYWKGKTWTVRRLVSSP